MQRLSWLVVGFLALLVALVFFSIKSSDSFNKVPVPVLQDDECKRSLRFRNPAPRKRFTVNQTLLTSMELPPKVFADLSTNVLQQFVPVTGASSNHFTESIDGVASMQTNMPGKTIIYYDLGLKPAEIARLNTWCNVEYRKFNTTGYPPFVKNLLYYAWKPIIIQEVLRQYPAVFWMDASFRWKTPNMTQLYQRARDSDGFVLFGKTGHSNFAVTHPGMYSYLPTNVVRQKRTEQFGATSAFVVNTRSNYDEVLYLYYLCALTQDCIAPTTNRVCKFTKDRHGRFANCHRFDQSLANVLLSNKWCYNSTRYSLLDRSLFAIKRSVTSHFKIKVCKKP